MSCITITSKIIFAFLAELLLSSGVVCMVLGSVVVYRYYNYFGAVDALTPFYYILVASFILIMLGLILICAGICGFCNSCMENRCCLCTFFGFLSLIVILMVTASVLGFVYNDQIGEALKDELLTAFHKYDLNLEVKKVVDDIQSSFTCCGVESPSDWNQFRGALPPSCYSLQEEGCYSKVKSLIINNILPIFGGAVGLMVVIGSGMLLSCGLIFKKKEKKEDEEKVKIVYEMY